MIGTPNELSGGQFIPIIGSGVTKTEEALPATAGPFSWFTRRRGGRGGVEFLRLLRLRTGGTRGL